jgi:hypothetical protein
LTNLRLPDSVDTPQLQPISDTHLLDNKHRYSQLDLPFPFLSSRPPTFVLPHSLNTTTRKPRHQTHLRRPIPFSPRLSSTFSIVGCLPFSALSCFVADDRSTVCSLSDPKVNLSYSRYTKRLALALDVNHPPRNFQSTLTFVEETNNVRIQRQDRLHCRSRFGPDG